MSKTVVFKNLKSITGYVYHHLDNPTPVKVNKSLYFLWGFYRVSYGTLNNYPDQLFSTNFYAAKYGPLIKTVCEWQKNQQIKTLPNNFSMDNQIDNEQLKNELKSFMDDILDQVNQTHDFQLCLRSQKDIAWQTAYHKTAHHLLNPNQIQKDYQKYLN